MGKNRQKEMSATHMTNVKEEVRAMPKSQAKLEELITVLRQSEAKLQNIVGNAIEGIFQTDREGRLTHANPSFARIHGYDSPAEIKDAIFAKDLFVDPSDHARLIQVLRERGSVQSFEARLKMKNGNIHWVSMNIMVFRDERGKALRYEGTMLDITERKRAEEALTESEERYRIAIENSNDGISILEADICQYANKQYMRMFGFDHPEEIIGKSIKPTIHPEDVAMVTDILERRQRAEPVPSRYEFRGITKKGDMLYVEVSAASITFRGKLFDLIYFRDVTERRRAEESLKKSHRELERLNKAKDKAVHHISHELKTPLAVIQGVIGILRRKFQEASPPALTETLDTLERNTERLLEISRETDEIFRVSQEVEVGMAVNDLDRLLEKIEDLSHVPEAIRTSWEQLKEWTVSHLGAGFQQAEPTDLYTSVELVLEKMSEASLNRHLQLSIHGHKGFFVHVDPSILGSVAWCLIKNAIENTPDRGSIEVTVGRDESGIFLKVADRGIGITEENQGSLLDGLFHTEETDLYSTKKPFAFGAGGKGLELLRIRHYAERYHFNISFESKRCIYIPTDRDICPGDITLCSYCRSANDCKDSGGTTFTVTFPQADAA